jgi:hypothetical protein
MTAFNTLFYDKSKYLLIFQQQKGELYSNLYIILSTFQLKLKKALSAFLTQHRITQLANALSPDKLPMTSDRVLSLVSFKGQQDLVLRAGLEIMELWAFSNFEMLDELDFRHYVAYNLDWVYQHNLMRKSKSSVYRALGKRQKLKNSSSFIRVAYNQVDLQKKDLFLKRCPILIDSLVRVEAH